MFLDEPAFVPDESRVGQGAIGVADGAAMHQTVGLIIIVNGDARIAVELDELRQAVIEGAVHRLRPKLLTEGVAIIAIFPMVFATGVGGEILAPMALPVLGFAFLIAAPPVSPTLSIGGVKFSRVP